MAGSYRLLFLIPFFLTLSERPLISQNQGALFPCCVEECIGIKPPHTEHFLQNLAKLSTLAKSWLAEYSPSPKKDAGSVGQPPFCTCSEKFVLFVTWAKKHEALHSNPLFGSYLVLNMLAFAKKMKAHQAPDTLTRSSRLKLKAYILAIKTGRKLSKVILQKTAAFAALWNESQNLFSQVRDEYASTKGLSNETFTLLTCAKVLATQHIFEKKLGSQNKVFSGAVTLLHKCVSDGATVQSINELVSLLQKIKWENG